MVIILCKLVRAISFEREADESCAVALRNLRCCLTKPDVEYYFMKYNIVPTKRCCWGVCTSDSRYPEKLPEGVFFIPFVKPDLRQVFKNKQNEKMANEQIKRHVDG